MASRCWARSASARWCAASTTAPRWATRWTPRSNLHRLQAAYRPENLRSGQVLQRLGFREIGLARDYLCIDGAWCDHLLTERINPAFREANDATLR